MIPKPASEPTSATEMRGRATRGAMWATVEVWGNEALQFVMFAVLARLLGPEAYGVLGLALILILAGQTMIAAGGWMEAIIQRQDLRPDHLDSIFYFVCSLALLLAGLTTACSGLIASAFGEKALVDIIPWLALALPIASLNVVPLGLLQRELRLAPLAIRSTVGVIVAGSVAIVMALNDGGVWSLVAYELIQPVVGVIVFWSCERWRPGLGFSWTRLGEIMGFSVKVSAERCVLLGENLVPRIITGRLLGTSSVGHWTLARKIFDFSAELVQRPAMRVAMPAFSRAQGEPETLVRMLSTAVELTALAAVPGYVLLLTLAPGLVSLLFGEAWLPAATLLQILAIAGFFMPAQQLLLVLMQAVGRPGASLTVAAGGLVVLLMGMLAMAPWGLTGIAAAFVLRTVCLVIGRAFYLNRILQCSLLPLIVGTLPVAISGAAMLLAIVAVETSLGEMWGTAARLAFEFAAGCAAYLAALGLVARPLLRRCVSFARSALSGRTPAVV